MRFEASDPERVSLFFIQALFLIWNKKYKKIRKILKNCKKRLERKF